MSIETAAAPGPADHAQGEPAVRGRPRDTGADVNDRARAGAAAAGRTGAGVARPASPEGGTAPRGLPAPPQAALRVLQACADPDADAGRIAAVVELDPALTAQVLRVVNSAFFGFLRKVGSARQAVTILGQRALRNYALCLAVRDALRPSALQGLDTTRFWDQSLRRACAGRVLAPAAGADPDTAFTACLLQDVGLLAMVHARPDRAGSVDALLALDPDDRAAREQEVFSRTHEVAGLELARAWDLPDELAAAIGHHHAAAGTASRETAQPLARIAHCADWMAAVFHAEDTRHTIARARRACADCFGLPEDEVDRLLGQVSEQVAEAGRALDMQVQSGRTFDELLRDANLSLAEENLGYQELAWRLQHTLDEREALSRRLREEVEKARLVQRALLPDPGTQTLFRGMNAPARELSGDFYDYFQTAAGPWCFTLGDVSGKGMDAALLMSKTGSLFHCLGKAIADPGRLLGALNAELCELNVRGMFVTMIAGVFEPDTGQVSLSNAGHPPALLLDRRGRARPVAAGAPPLGVMPGCQFPVERHALAGHTLYLYSDGVMEAAEARHRCHGADAVIGLLRRLERAPSLQHPARLVNALARPGQPPDDDLTVLVVDGTAAG